VEIIAPSGADDQPLMEPGEWPAVASEVEAGEEGADRRISLVAGVHPRTLTHAADEVGQVHGGDREWRNGG
jgi:hypothetical protein